ncbi:MAG TPA: LysM peptidoglycan-binding domain-containing protein [Methylomirabilota bacterium]|nr:LysM peptidoglycan-binding domain-containing protein [Methylomirabilota bacterium]
MNTPNPLMPQGSLLRPKGGSNVRLAVVAIIAVHLIFFGSLLLVPGCSKENKDAGTGAGATNTNSAAYTMPPMDTSYYSSPTNLPVADTGIGSNAVGATTVDTSFPGTNLAVDTGATATGAITSLPPVTIDQMPSTPESKEYVVQKGDSYYKIAKLHNTTVGAVAKANPSVNPAKLKVGQRIQVPVGSPGSAISGTGSGSTPGTATANGQSNGNGATSSYTVKAGDTLTKIAQRNGTTVKAIRQANNLRTDRVNVGQKLKIPARNGGGNNGSAPAAAPASTAPLVEPTAPTFNAPISTN